MGITPSVHIAAFVALTLGTFSMGVTSLSVLGLAAGIADDHENSAGIGASLVAAYAGAIVIASVMLPLTPIGRAPLVVQAASGQAFMALAAAFCAFSSSMPELLAGRAVAGVGSALFGPSCVGLAVLLAPVERRGRMMSWVFAGFTVAPVLGLPLVAWLSEHAGWRQSFGVMCGMAALACMTLLAALRRHVGYRERVAEHAVYGVLTCRPLLFGLTTTVMHVAARFALFAPIAGLLVEYCGLARASLPAALLLFGLAGAAGNLVGGQLTDRSSSMLTVAASLVGLAASAAILLSVPSVSLVVLFAFTGAMFTIGQQSELIRHAGPGRRSTVLSLNTTALSIGMALGASAGGVAHVMLGFEATIAVSMALTLAATGSFMAGHHSR